MLDFVERAGTLLEEKVQTNRRRKVRKIIFNSGFFFYFIHKLSYTNKHIQSMHCLLTIICLLRSVSNALCSYTTILENCTPVFFAFVLKVYYSTSFIIFGSYRTRTI